MTVNIKLKPLYKYIMLAVIVVILGIHLIQKKTNPTHSYLPQIPEIMPDSITKIVIKKSDESLTLLKNGRRWTIFPEKGHADQDMANKIIRTVINLNVIMMISKTDDYIVFGLDNRNKIVVSVYNNEFLLYDFEVGNVGPSRAHTFVRLQDDDRVFYVEGSIRDTFNISANDLILKKNGFMGQRIKGFR